MELLTRRYRTTQKVIGPLLFVERATRISIGEMVRIILSEGDERLGQVIEVSEEHAVIQMLEESRGVSIHDTDIYFTGSAANAALSLDMLGRRFDGIGRPVDGLPPILPETRSRITGSPINPVERGEPSDFIQTGLSAIDGLNTLVRGQKLPIFSASGLPAKEIAGKILRQARVVGEGERFAVVFAAIGITHREASFFIEEFERGAALHTSVLFLNLAEDPVIERLLTPRFAMTTAEYLAFEHGFHVLVILTDMTNYCEALREVATAREEIPGRRGYPGYMYTDLATLYERAGCLKRRKGSITQIPIVTMPDEDITHPIPDLTGYITEGQIVLSRELHRKGVYPPIDVLPSLSRLMNLGIGAGKTREDHREASDQLYAFYAQGRDLRRVASIIGEEGLTEPDRILLKFADDFERGYIHQGDTTRSIVETLDYGWGLLRRFPRDRFTRVRPDIMEKYYGGTVKP
ncbi:MAG: V-type ATP synthase subunit B [Nitrospirae bacterium]|nr:V-type ATP synthase subunit B [Nitrospirota bacterium]